VFKGREKENVLMLERVKEEKGRKAFIKFAKKKKGI